MSNLSHVDSQGKANMVDVGNKPLQIREARAIGFIRMKPETLQLILDNQMKKGDVLTVAEVAGIQAAKQTSQLIPLCHSLSISSVHITTTSFENGIRAESRVKCTGQTGVEMEALTAVAVTLLTVYDMCKAVDKQMEITEITLVEKTKKDMD